MCCDDILDQFRLFLALTNLKERWKFCSSRYFSLFTLQNLLFWLCKKYTVTKMTLFPLNLLEAEISGAIVWADGSICTAVRTLMTCQNIEKITTITWLKALNSCDSCSSSTQKCSVLSLWELLNVYINMKSYAWRKISETFSEAECKSKFSHSRLAQASTTCCGIFSKWS